MMLRTLMMILVVMKTKRGGERENERGRIRGNCLQTQTTRQQTTQVSFFFSSCSSSSCSSPFFLRIHHLISPFKHHISLSLPLFLVSINDIVYQRQLYICQAKQFAAWFYLQQQHQQRIKFEGEERTDSIQTKKKMKKEARELWERKKTLSELK